MTLLWQLRDKLEKLLRSYSSFQDLLPDELTIPKNFPNCFVNKAILEAIKQLNFHLIIIDTLLFVEMKTQEKHNLHYDFLNGIQMKEISIKTIYSIAFAQKN